MFGYVVANKPEMKIREFAQYKSYYCGLCHALRSEYGLTAGFTLTYDMTFLILLLGSLYEPRVESDVRHCPIHPVRKVRMRQTWVTEYAAGMNLLLARDHMRDDWEDERRLVALAGDKLFSKRAKNIENLYPRQAQAVEEALAKLHMIERDYLYRWSILTNSEFDTSSFIRKNYKYGDVFDHVTGWRKNSLGKTKVYDTLDAAELDEIARPFSEMMGEIFVMKDDSFAPTLRNIGFYLGKYIYIRDALDDLEKDRKNNSFNPFLLARMTREYVSQIEQWQQTTLNTCIAEFEKLPLERDVAILRNILYEGVRLSKEKKVIS